MSARARARADALSALLKSYQFEPFAMLGQKFPSSVTTVRPSACGTAYLPVMCSSKDQSPTAMLSAFARGAAMLFCVMT